MTQAEEILKKAINEYCSGVYAKSSMNAVDYNIAIYAIQKALTIPNSPTRQAAPSGQTDLSDKYK